MSKESITTRTLKLLRGQGRVVVLLVGLIIVAAGFDIVVPFISQRLIDTLINFFRNGGPAPTLFLLLAASGIFLATVLNRAVRSFYDYRLMTTSTRTEDKIKNQAFEKYLGLHALFHHGSSSGQLIGRIERGATAIYIIINDIFGQSLLPPLAIFLGVFTALLLKNFWIALIVLLPLPIYLLVIKRLTDRIYEIDRQAHEEYEQVAKHTYDVAGNVLTVKKFSQEHAEAAVQAELQDKFRTTQYQAERLWVAIETSQTVIATAGRIAVILLGGFMVIRGQSSVGEFVLYVTLQNMAYSPLAQLSVLFPRLRRNISRAERLFAVLDEPVHITNQSDATELPVLHRAIEFRKVSFGYREISTNNESITNLRIIRKFETDSQFADKPMRWAIRNVSVTIPANSTVALVGRSGSGKTTFVNLLLRSYDPQEGAICIDGTDIRTVTQTSLRAQVAVVPQEVDLFSRTISENIAYGKPAATRAEVEAAARTALAHNFIQNLENGYDTVVGERGVKLSGGERQRIGIARAVLKDPRILIFDEATSHLDTESEQLIRRATEAVMRDRTTIIIAHRLSTILKADTIFVFHLGRLEARGTHAELLRRSPTYKKLYTLQFARE
ncbi:MAG: ABC transporter ATP-binding protein [Candidatus Liptonbacteria bacterium]|nr:ABC transporter ATP-binding protein [Candidatus Liptonbacteria bacterium]